MPSTAPPTDRKKVPKPTYESAIVAELMEAGILSRPALVARLTNKHSLSNAQHVTANLKRLTNANAIEFVASSYTLGAARIDALSKTEQKAHVAAMKAARGARKATVDAKAAGQKREAKRVGKALVVARRPVKKTVTKTIRRDSTLWSKQFNANRRRSEEKWKRQAEIDREAEASAAPGEIYFVGPPDSPLLCRKRPWPSWVDSDGRDTRTAAEKSTAPMRDEPDVPLFVLS